MIILTLVFILVAPYFVQYVSERYQPFKFSGSVINCFLLGLGYAALAPVTEDDRKTLETIGGAMVPLGISCMLFSTDLNKWLKLSLKVMLAFVLCIVAVITASAFAYFYMGRTIEEPAAVAAMLTGAYTGGAPNMTAIHNALQKAPELYRNIFISDVLASSLYMFFIFAGGKQLISLFLRKYKPSNKGTGNDSSLDLSAPFYALPVKSRFRQVLLSLGLAILVAALCVLPVALLSGGLENMDLTWLMILLTVAGVAVSFIDRVRDMPGNFETGDYIFCMFFMAFGCMTNFSDLLSLSMPYLYFTLVVLFGSVVLHLLLCRLFRVDTDTMIITSMAGIMSPPFIPSVAARLKNREIIVPGITAGIVGLAAGNILGITLAKVLSAYLPF